MSARLSGPGVDRLPLRRDVTDASARIDAVLDAFHAAAAAADEERYVADTRTGRRLPRDGPG